MPPATALQPTRLVMPMFVFVLKIPIAVSGIRGMGFLMKYHMEGGGNLPPKLSNLFIKVRLFYGNCLVVVSNLGLG